MQGLGYSETDAQDKSKTFDFTLVDFSQKYLFMQGVGVGKGSSGSPVVDPNNFGTVKGMVVG